MKVIDHIEDFIRPDYSVVTMGIFDGVHLAHQTILKKIVAEAARHPKGKSILMTFWPHPRYVLSTSSDDLKLLTTFEEKMKLIARVGVDYVLKIPFTSAFSNMSATAFVERFLIDRVATKKLFVGYNHHFGKNREGNIDFLKKNETRFGFEMDEISRLDIDQLGVSSTKIRKALEQGDVSLASSLLGRNYSLGGVVIHGDKKGRSIGFPTANLSKLKKYKLLPREGVYAVRVRIGNKEHRGMCNIGTKPTLNGKNQTIEVHLFEFENQIYGEEITLSFVRMLREERKFDSLEKLKDQLILDKVEAQKIVS